MPAMRDTARVHADTVTEASKGAHARRPRKRAEPQPQATKVRASQVHPAAMLAAQEALSSGSYTRIEVVSASEVIVR